MYKEEPCLCLKVLGARGSMAVTRKDQQVFGGNTSCYMIQAGEETVFFDAGSGLLNAPVDFPRPPHILVSHMHLDHILGLGMYPRLSQKGRKTLIYVPVGPGEDPVRLLGGVFSPPYWPVSLDSYSGEVGILPLAFPLRIGDLLIEGAAGNHPGGNFIFRISRQGRSIVYASDYEYEEQSFHRLMEMAAGADLVLLDGQYTAKELAQRRGFGHSCPEMGLKLKEQCGIDRLWLVHHDPQRTDEQLLDWEDKIARENVHFAREDARPAREDAHFAREDVHFAREGEEILLWKNSTEIN